MVFDGDKGALALQLALGAYVTFLAGHYHADHLRRAGVQSRLRPLDFT